MSNLLPGQAEAIQEINELRTRISVADTDTMALLLGQAHTLHAWTDKPVDNEKLKEAYDLAKVGPTGMNIQPMRIVFLREEEKEKRLVPLMLDSNQEKTRTAPVTAIIAVDQAFYKNMNRVFPIMPEAAAMFEGNPDMARENAERNGTLQAAYFMIALRSVGLDVAPMSGFNPVAVNNEFFSGSDTTVNFIVNIGYGDSSGVYPRLPRLEFDEVARFY
ncbi:malonic semialdehyde reductase [Vibrio sp. VB16]|uniref:malonic semialdehyde reductase n=1 Tax=Vibrio sp. VB16 TaxID=2785746 RepID=UPI00189CFFBC|nr:malonic semialdehyde reductase [Vibrio sp. VB16]UGA53569.1 malonic semialdehyde reductase [Vibrio sp. VB16]